MTAATTVNPASNSAEACDQDARRRSLTVDATAEISEISRAVRGLVHGIDNQAEIVVKALMVRVEALADAILYTVDPEWKQSLDDVAEIVEASKQGVAA